jgi:hypothetical protein
MTETIQKTRRAAAINRFGGIEEIKLQMLPVPEIEPDEVLIRIESAGSGHLGRIRARWRLRQVCSALSRSFLMCLVRMEQARWRTAHPILSPEILLYPSSVTQASKRGKT